MIVDVHVHFFSPEFFRLLWASKQGAPTAAADGDEDPATLVPRQLGWTPSTSSENLADDWVAELDRHGVARASVMASIPGDEASVAAAVARHPDRFFGAFMLNPAAPDAAGRLETTFADPGMRMACLFPAMHNVAVDDPRSVAVFEAARRHRRALFVHCGLLSVGVRKKVGLPSLFDIRLGDPLAVAAVAQRFPDVPVVIPHFGAGFFREALMAASLAPNVFFDTSSSNSWMATAPRLALRDVFERSLEVAGPGRLLFGTDSSFFPRGWQSSVYESQLALLQDLGVEQSVRSAIFGGNALRVLGEGRVTAAG